MKFFSYNELKSTVKILFGQKMYILMFAILFLVVGMIYGYMLLNAAEGIFDFGVYYVYFDIISTAIISFLISLVITVNVYAYKIKSKGTRKFGIASVISAILPSSLCCTSIVPSLLAVGGASTSFIVGNTGKIQSVFSTYGPLFIVFGAALAYIGLIQAIKNLNNGCILNEKSTVDCCEVENENKI